MNGKTEFAIIQRDGARCRTLSKLTVFAGSSFLLAATLFGFLKSVKQAPGIGTR